MEAFMCLLAFLLFMGCILLLAKAVIPWAARYDRERMTEEAKARAIEQTLRKWKQWGWDSATHTALDRIGVDQ